MRGTFRLLGAALACAAGLTLSAPASAQGKKLNILIIWGDDIGGFNLERVMESLTSGQPQGN